MLHWLRRVWVLSLLVLVPGGGWAQETGESLAIIVNKANPIESLSLQELRKIFLAEQTYWPNGKRITLVMRETGQPERNAALRQIYHMDDRGFIRHFLQTTFTDGIQIAPKYLATSTGARKFVVYVPSAIGYLRGAEIDDSVKVLRIDGHLPGEKGYPLTLVP